MNFHFQLETNGVLLSHFFKPPGCNCAKTLTQVGITGKDVYVVVVFVGLFLNLCCKEPWLVLCFSIMCRSSLSSAKVCAPATAELGGCAVS